MSGSKAETLWPYARKDWTPKDPGDTDLFIVDATDKLAERPGALIAATPVFSSQRDDGGAADLLFSQVIVGPGNQIVDVLISGGTAGFVYLVTMQFRDTAGRTLDRSQLLAVVVR